MGCGKKTTVAFAHHRPCCRFVWRTAASTVSQLCLSRRTRHAAALGPYIRADPASRQRLLYERTTDLGRTPRGPVRLCGLFANNVELWNGRPLWNLSSLRNDPVRNDARTLERTPRPREFIHNHSDDAAYLKVAGTLRVPPAENTSA